MAWLTRTNWLTTEKPANTDINNIGLDIRTWGGDVNAGANALINCKQVNLNAVVLPGTPATGALVLDTADSILKYYNGSAWVKAGYAVRESRATNSIAQSIPNATTTALTFDTNVFDTGGIHSTVTNTSRFTVPTGGAGTYLISGVVSFALSATGARLINIRKGGIVNLASSSQVGFSGFSNRLCISLVAQLSDADYLEITVYQDSGAALNVNGNEAETAITVKRL